MKHDIFEKHSMVLLIGILIVVAIGGLVEIVPLFLLGSTIEKVQGMRPYSPLELAGRDIYLREGCYNCHSQMIRSLRDEVERYGHYSLAAESMYDHPFQWGSKRTGPDLARVGGKYSDAWHVEHMTAPRDDRAGLGHAGLSVPRRAQARCRRHRRPHAGAEARRRALHRRDDRQGERRSRRADQSGFGRRQERRRALPEGAGAQVRRQRRRPSRPSSMRSSPICRCSARSSTSRSSTKPARTCAERGMR